jgi:RHS repeat-associated protein
MNPAAAATSSNWKWPEHRNRNRFYYLHNTHGDVTCRVSETGDATPEYIYDAFGNLCDESETDPNPFKYCGDYWDKETGTYYLRNRCYSPGNGRFTSEDPIRSGLNWYAYTANNPIKYIDPLGLMRVNMVDYMKAMDADVEEYTKNGEAYAKFLYNGESKNYKLNSGTMDDQKINDIFGWENSWIPNGKTEAVYTGVHSVALGNYHSSVIIFADLGSKYYDTDNFKVNLYDGGNVQYSTLGAGSVDGKLISGINQTKDLDLEIKVQMMSMGIYDVTTANKLFDSERHYYDTFTDVNYDLFPVANKTSGFGYGKGYNSNSFASGLLGAVGITPVTPSYTVPRFDKPLPTSYFG